MMISRLFFLICLFLQTQSYGQQLVHSIYLIGDAGLSSPENLAYQKLLKSNLDSTVNNTILFLGDNIYPQGMPDQDDPTRERCEEILKTQASIANELKATAYFIPGNHDWKRGRKAGLHYLKNQQDFIDSLHFPDVTITPRNGCPGPVAVKINPSITLIMIDSQWFLQKRGKPQGKNSECECKTMEEFEHRFRKLLDENKSSTVIVAAHHPIFTYGEHGGVYPFMSHIFPLVDVQRWLYIPLPVVGSLYPLYRKLIGHIQDTQHPANRAYRKMITRNIELYPGSIYVSGHEHTLQHARKGNVHYIVSGSSVKKEFVRKRGYAQYVSHKLGFARIDHYSDGSSMIRFFENDTDKITHEVEIKK